MKNNECAMSARRVSLHDRQQLAKFATDLDAVIGLVRGGHTRQCARLMVFGPESGIPGHCRCKAEAPPPEPEKP